MFMLEVVATRARLEQLEAEWNALADRLGSPLLRHEWFVETARAFSPTSSLAVHIVRDASGVRAIAPLVLQRQDGVMRLKMLGSENYEPEAFLYDDVDALELVCATVARLRQPLLMLRLDAGARELPLLRGAQRGRGLAVVRAGSSRTYACPIHTPDWTAFQATMSSGRRKELERKRRKLEQLGAVSFEALTPDPAAWDAPYGEFVDLEGSGWKGRQSSAIRQDRPAFNFHLDYGRDLARRGMLRLFCLRLDGRLIAAQYHVQHAGKLWELKIAYDEAFGRYSPGALLTHEILRYACGEGLHGLEHLGLAEDWQTRWPTQEGVYSTLRIYPATPRGAYALVLDSFKFLRKEARPARGQASPEAPEAPDATAPADAAITGVRSAAALRT